MTAWSAPATASLPRTSLAIAEARNVRLQYLRGFAACSVLLYHASNYINTLRADDRLLAVFSDFLGRYGVAVFFALSGYLMADLIRREAPGRFLLNRILRIYPLMLIVVALAAALFALTGFSRAPDPLALTLIPAGPRDYFLSVEWTLLFEMTYYVVLATLAFLGLLRLAAPLFLLWLCVLAAASLLGREMPENLSAIITELPLLTANAAFLIGFLLPAALRRGWVPPVPVLLAGAVGIAAIFLIWPDSHSRWIASLSAPLLVAAAVKAPLAMASGPFGRLGARLGDASYALYLCHVPVIVISGNLVSPAVPTALLWTGWVFASLALSLGLGALDVGLHRRLKAWSRALDGRHVAIASLAFIALFVGIAIASDIGVRRTRQAEANARIALSENPVLAQDDVAARIDAIAALPNGRLILRGYGIDLRTPDALSHVAILQNGSLVGFDRMRRLRPLIAQELARPDIAKVRFGFSVVLRDPLDCAKGPLEARLILGDGRVVPVDGAALVEACPT